MTALSISELTIEPITLVDFEVFFKYLNDHLSDNGQSGAPYFQPLPRGESVFSSEKAKFFREALAVPMGEPGWRRLWGAFAPNRKLIGHIDLRAHAERFAAHRCLLGMGVDRSFRSIGLGQGLIAHAEKWARENGSIEWIDLQVLSINEPAIRLYHRTGFVKTGEVPEMFRLDGRSLSYTSMTKWVGIFSNDIA
ncbi:MAG: N-acetyltransferase [Massilia sp.]|nr:N-acetyltransferase [Massilia sp.]